MTTPLYDLTIPVFLKAFANQPREQPGLDEAEHCDYTSATYIVKQREKPPPQDYLSLPAS